MRTRKIRGHKRRWADIERWVDHSKRLDIEYLKEYQRDYVKIWVAPWSGISITNSTFAEPRGKTKAKILSGLLEVYDSWKIELDKLDKPYYLKIWLHEPRFSNSQVVCAIDDCIDFYKNTFYKPDSSKELEPANYGKLSKQMAEFNWEYRFDEDHFDDSEVGEPGDFENETDYLEHKKWFNNMLKKPHRTFKFKEPIGNATESYSFHKGIVWLGEK